MKHNIKYILLIFLCVLFMSGCSKQDAVELKPFENIKVEETGWNKKGQVKVVSYEVHYTGNDQTINKLINSFQYSIKNNKGLKNGDVVTIKLIYDSDLKALANVRFDKTQCTYTVHGLHNDDRKVKTITNKKKDPKSGEIVDVAEQIITVDGIEIPAGWNLSEEEIQDYISYVKSIEGDEDSTESGVKDDWIQGESESKTHRKDSKYFTKDYNNNDVECYQVAYGYGYTSSQLFKVKPVFKDDKSIGYECIFKENSNE